MLAIWLKVHVTIIISNFPPTSYNSSCIDFHVSILALRIYNVQYMYTVHMHHDINQFIVPSYYTYFDSQYPGLQLSPEIMFEQEID